ncbi:MAG: hypothetical protein IH627_18325 [Rubrivivax sp.]|nr:hypothetical protein [Rubrivivax sp.]
MIEIAVTSSTAIRQGDEQLDCGAGIEHDAEVVDEITCSATDAMHGPHAMDPDVLAQAATKQPVVDVLADVSADRVPSDDSGGDARDSPRWLAKARWSLTRRAEWRGICTISACRQN